MSEDPLLSRLDLNLLVSLDALLTERNVTRAAARLHLSQPSLSAALARLRVHFDDQLLARRGNTYELTPLATRLLEHTSQAITAVRRVFESQAAWDPSASMRQFTVYGSDYALSLVAPRVSRQMNRLAPNVRLRLVPTMRTAIDDIVHRLASIDGLLLPHGVTSGHSSLDLWHDDWVIVADPDNPRTIGGVTADVLAESPWVYTYQTRNTFTAVGRQREQLGIQPKAEAIVESFALLPLYVVGTERLGFIQRRLAPLATRLADVAVHPLPFDTVPIIQALWWHPAHDADPEHRWFRSLFDDAAQELSQVPSD